MPKIEKTVRRAVEEVTQNCNNFSIIIYEKQLEDSSMTNLKELFKTITSDIKKQLEPLLEFTNHHTWITPINDLNLACNIILHNLNQKAKPLLFSLGEFINQIPKLISALQATEKNIKNLRHHGNIGWSIIGQRGKFKASIIDFCNRASAILGLLYNKALKEYKQLLENAQPKSKERIRQKEQESIHQEEENKHKKLEIKIKEAEHERRKARKAERERRKARKAERERRKAERIRQEEEKERIRQEEEKERIRQEEEKERIRQEEAKAKISEVLRKMQILNTFYEKDIQEMVKMAQEHSQKAFSARQEAQRTYEKTQKFIKDKNLNALAQSDIDYIKKLTEEVYVQNENVQKCTNELNELEKNAGALVARPPHSASTGKILLMKDDFIAALQQAYKLIATLNNKNHLSTLDQCKKNVKNIYYSKITGADGALYKIRYAAQQSQQHLQYVQEIYTKLVIIYNQCKTSKEVATRWFGSMRLRGWFS